MTEIPLFIIIVRDHLKAKSWRGYYHSSAVGKMYVTENRTLAKTYTSKKDAEAQIENWIRGKVSTEYYEIEAYCEKQTSGEGCKLAGNCYRKTATPNEWRQSYFAKPPMNDDGTCTT